MGASEQDMDGKRDILECVPQAHYCLLKPSGPCFTSAQLKRRFTVHVVSVTRPGPHLRRTKNPGPSITTTGLSSLRLSRSMCVC